MSTPTDGLLRHNSSQLQINAGTSYFPGAQNTTLYNPVITHVQGDYYTTHQISGLHLLERHISHDAMFDSAARYPAGECHPGTRTKVIDVIKSWIEDPQPKEEILWLRGLAGVGKSALMQTIAQLLHQTNTSRNAGSFFFSIGITGRQEAKFLFPTLAYQIAINFPAVRPLIETAMNNDLALPTKSMPSQIRSLIVDPFRTSNFDFSKHTPTVIIDGLDECHGSSSQTQILACIADALASRVPLRFLIASRPEHWIKTAFNRKPLVSVTKVISLDDYRASESASGLVYSDIGRYLRDGFDDIYALNPSVMADVKPPWPSSKVLEHLVSEAAGQFIYASTVLKFVGYSSEFSDPQGQLDILLDDNDIQLRASAFREIDQLYTRILSSYPRRKEPLKRILGALTLGLKNPASIEMFLGIEKREAYIIFDFLSSVTVLENKGSPFEDDTLTELLSPRDINTVVWFSHKSFRDFILNKDRSGEYAVDTKALRHEIVSRFFKVITGVFNGDADPEKYNMWRYLFIVNLMEDTDMDVLAPLLYQLHSQIQSFVHGGSSGVPSPPVLRPFTLICALSCVLKLITHNRFQRRGRVHENSHPNNMDSIKSSIPILIGDKCFPKIIENMFRTGYMTMDESIVYLTSGIFVSEERVLATTDLPGISGVRPFVEKHPGSIYYRLHGANYNNEEVFLCFIEEVDGFLAHYIRGEEKIRYHNLWLRVCTSCLLHLISDPSVNEMRAQIEAGNMLVARVICRSLDNVEFTRYWLDSGDVTPFSNLITMILDLKWAQSERLAITGQWHLPLSISAIVLKWVQRWQHVYEEHNAALARRMRNFEAELFEAAILPSVTAPINSYLQKLSSALLDQPLDWEKLRASNSGEVNEAILDLEPLWATSSIVQELVEGLSTALRTQLVTRATELYLNIWAMKRYRRVLTENEEPFDDPSDISYFVLKLRVYISPTPQILSGLRLLHRLDQRLPSTYLPTPIDPDILLWIQSILKEFDISTQEMEQFQSWLDSGLVTVESNEREMERYWRPE